MSFRRARGLPLSERGAATAPGGEEDRRRVGASAEVASADRSLAAGKRASLKPDILYGTLTAPPSVRSSD
ncbi:hypothetical protein VM98_36750, partial [Streptomyces rubellomurinus subsp. indigoferus]